jgi:hypothetical protein
MLVKKVQLAAARILHEVERLRLAEQALERHVNLALSKTVGSRGPSACLLIWSFYKVVVVVVVVVVVGGDDEGLAPRVTRHTRATQDTATFIRPGRLKLAYYSVYMTLHAYNKLL